MALKRISFQSIPVDDQDRALAFYRDILGFEVHTDAPFDDGWRWVFLTIPGAETRLQFAKRSDITVHDKPALALACDDVDAECVRWRDAGVNVTNEPRMPHGNPACAGRRYATAKTIIPVHRILEGGHEPWPTCNELSSGLNHPTRSGSPRRRRRTRNTTSAAHSKPGGAGLSGKRSGEPATDRQRQRPRYGAIWGADRRLLGLNNIELITDRRCRQPRGDQAVKRDYPTARVVVSLMVPCEEAAGRDPAAG